MKENIFLIAIIVIIFFYGCNGRKNFFSNNVIMFDDKFEISSTIRGDKLPVANIFSISSLICLDEYLLVLTPRAKNVFNVLSLSGEILSQFGTIGRANDELMNCQFNGQIKEIDGHKCVWINDVTKTRMVLIDIDKSIQNNKITIIKEMKTPPKSVFCFCVNDSILISEQLRVNNYDLVEHNIVLNTFSENTLYIDDVANAFSLYKSIWRLDSYKSKMVGVMQSINQINIYSMVDHERYSIVIGEMITDKNELVDAETGLERRTAFCDLEMTNSYIYALYMNQEYKDAYEKSKPQEVLIFDWNGGLDRVIRLNEYIIDITVSSDGEYLYGRTLDDDIYCYKLI